MNDRQKRTVAALQQVLIYFEVHPLAAEPPLLARSRESLQRTIDQVRALSVRQLTALEEMNGHVEHYKQALREGRMMKLKRIGTKRLRNLVSPDALRIPHKRENAPAVAEAALRMATVFEPYPDLLADAGLPPDFLAAMRQEAHDLKLSARRSETARNHRSLATRDIAGLLDEAMDTVTIIEGLVMEHYGTDKGTMRTWKQFRRVQKRKGRPRTRKAPRAGVSVAKGA